MPAVNVLSVVVMKKDAAKIPEHLRAKADRVKETEENVHFIFEGKDSEAKEFMRELKKLGVRFWFFGYGIFRFA